MSLTMRGETGAWEEVADLLAAVMRDNADAILVVDGNEDIVHANPSAGRLFGRTPQDLIGQAFGFPVTPGRTTEIGIPHDSGAVVAEMRVGRTWYRGESVCVVTLRDVTERKQVEEALRDFVSMASHEFRTPIAAISGFAETMLDNWPDLDDDTKLRYLKIILRQAGRLGRVAHDVLTVSRLEAGVLGAKTASVELIEAVAHAAAVVGADDLGLEVEAPGPTSVLADRDHVEEILVNFLANASKYGKPPVCVTITVDGDEVEVRVRDHGDGVSEAFEPSLFNRFTRGANSEVQGTGLGLAIVRGLAVANRGRVWYERPDDGPGAVFGFSLPRGT